MIRDFLMGAARLNCLRSGEWQFVAPNPALAPLFRKISYGLTSSASLIAEGNGRDECYGYALCRVQLKAERSYTLRVRLVAEGIDDIEHHVVHGLYGPSYSGGLFSLRSEGLFLVGEERIAGPAEAMEAELRVYFRYSARGRVTWEEISLEEREPIPPRLATFACREGQVPEGATLAYWGEWLDRAGTRQPDIALLPETFDGVSPGAAQPGDGPAAALLAAKARQWNMYTCGAVCEAHGDLAHTVAHLFDRSGQSVGTYRKLLPHESELDAGLSPGNELRVFDTDFARIGIMICFDSWFPEIARALARMGAEAILLPNVGYCEELMPARAADNGVCIAASSLLHPAGIWGSSGVRAGETVTPDSRESPSAIQSAEHDCASGLLVATIDLSKKYSPHWKGGPMASAPAARVGRVTSMQPLKGLEFGPGRGK